MLAEPPFQQILSNQRVSGFYSSSRPGVTGSSTQTVGQWLGT